jgi:hypothetical protein
MGDTVTVVAAAAVASTESALNRILFATVNKTGKEMKMCKSYGL